MSWKAWQWIVLAAFLLLCLAVGGIAGYWTAPAVAGWYRQIAKPSWTPPDWLFGPVWTTLYVLIGIAGWQVWRSRDSSAGNPALMFWSAQLAVNFIWSPLFFGMQAIGWALIDILVLWFLIGGFILAARRISPPAALLFVPYWLWVSYAGALNFAIWTLNPAQ